MTDLQNQLLDKLRAYWEKHPELRLGHIIADAAYVSNTIESYAGVFYIPDADLLRGLEKLEGE